MIGIGDKVNAAYIDGYMYSATVVQFPPNPGKKLNLKMLMYLYQNQFASPMLYSLHQFSDVKIENSMYTHKVCMVLYGIRVIRSGIFHGSILLICALRHQP